MAPEVIMREEYCSKADVWSIGCLYFQLLTGELPFNGKEISDLRENIKKGEWKIPVKKNNFKISKQCIEMLNSCLQFDPDDRLSFNDVKTHEYFNFSVKEDHDQAVVPNKYIHLNSKNTKIDPKILEKLENLMSLDKTWKSESSDHITEEQM